MSYICCLHSSAPPPPPSVCVITKSTPPSSLQSHALLLALLVIKLASCPIVTMRVVVFAATPLTSVIMLIIIPPSLAHSLLHPWGLIPRQAHTRQPQTSVPFSSNQSSPPPLFWWMNVVCVFSAFLLSLDCWRKRIVLSSSPVVAALSLPCSPHPTLPPSLADCDLGQ